MFISFYFFFLNVFGYARANRGYKYLGKGFSFFLFKPWCNWKIRMQQISQFTGFSLLFLTTATSISIIFSCKFVFRLIMSSPSFHISFHSWIKMNSTNWPAPNLWVFIAQLVDHCSANDNCNNHTIFTDFSLVIIYR